MSTVSRKYRPRLFADIAGQERVTETLRKEVEQGKLGHAYLFSGPRGVGKTTAARIFAKAVNCLDQKAGEPCLKCTACEKIAANQAIDIIEMDAASHTGVDNVREAIIEHVRFVPAALKYKVYVIDEAHMLTAQAWNALLKTIEEPPAYAIFLFATTEKHKVPATIVSRCQRFEFARVPEDQIVKRLAAIAKDESVKIDQKVLVSIAARSEGCLRDAENLLGQLMSLGEKNVTLDVASLVLAPSRLPQAAQLLSAAASREAETVLKLISDLEQDGVSLLTLFDDLLQAVRKLMVASVSAQEKAALSAGDEGQRALVPLIGSFDKRELVNVSLLLMERRREAKQGLDPRFAMELAMVAITEGMTVGLTHESSPGQPTRPSREPVPQPSVSTVKKDDPPPGPKPFEKSVIEPKTQEADKVTETDQKNSISTYTLNDVLVAWSKTLESLDNNKSLLFILKLCKPVSVEGNKLFLRFQYPYHRQTILGNMKNKQHVEDALRKTLNADGLVIDAAEGEDGAVENTSSKPGTVSRILEAFGGQVSA